MFEQARLSGYTTHIFFQFHPHQTPNIVSCDILPLFKARGIYRITLAIVHNLQLRPLPLSAYKTRINKFRRSKTRDVSNIITDKKKLYLYTVITETKKTEVIALHCSARVSCRIRIRGTCFVKLPLLLFALCKFLKCCGLSDTFSAICKQNRCRLVRFPRHVNRTQCTVFILKLLEQFCIIFLHKICIYGILHSEL